MPCLKPQFKSYLSEVFNKLHSKGIRNIAKDIREIVREVYEAVNERIITRDNGKALSMVLAAYAISRASREEDKFKSDTYRRIAKKCVELKLEKPAPLYDLFQFTKFIIGE